MKSFEIVPLGPFSWELATSWFESWQPVARHRPSEPGRLRLAFPRDRDLQGVAVELSWDGRAVRGVTTGDDVDAVARQVARFFSLDVDATSYPEVAVRDPDLGRVMTRFEGLRPLLFTTPYECAAWAVISQRISMRQAAAIQERLLEAHGPRFQLGGEEVIAFPAPEVLLGVQSVPGLASEKVERLRGVARAALSGLLDADRLRELGDEEGPASVRVIPGIGPFWSSGIYLRAAGVTDSFPDEPRSIAALALLKGLDHQPAGPELAALVEPFRPWRMWVAVLLRVAEGRDPSSLAPAAPLSPRSGHS